MQCLAESSVYGGYVWNAKVQHTALDAVKLKFVKGALELSIILILSIDFSCTFSQNKSYMFIFFHLLNRFIQSTHSFR